MKGKLFAAKAVVLIGFVSMLLWTVIMILTMGYAPLTPEQAGTDWKWALPVQDNLKALFLPSPIFFVSSLISYLISQYHDIWLYEVLKKLTKGKHLWLRNNVSTIVSALIDNTVFSLLAWIILPPEPLPLGVLSWIRRLSISRDFSSDMRKRRLKPIYADFSGLKPPSYTGFGFTCRETGIARARLGKLRCPHGEISTPNFIFCGTRATVKGISAEQLKQTQTDIVLANTYHLLVSPGAELIAAAGGLHKFMRWDGPILTDSGGYQVFAMGFGSVSEEIKGRRMQGSNTILKITEKGVRFKSYKDGRLIDLTPELSIDIQRKLGADFIVQFDECTPYHASREYTEQSMHLSARWGDRSLADFMRYDNGAQAMYGVVQGGIYPDLRRASVEYLAQRPFFGTAVGGCLGKTSEEMAQVVDATMRCVPKDRPVHLLGIGLIPDILHGVLKGIDTFDCVHPTRIARHGHAIMPGLPGNVINLKNHRFRDDHSPLNEAFDQPFMQYTKAYIHHLFRSEELLGAQLLTLNNIFMMNRLMQDIREGLTNGRYADVYRRWTGQAFPSALSEG
ncbi:hypothetical protein CHS0354_006835 [Potamilus streckersoni]|uniref:Queuine tRNA-ribosyltransferase catalytic subunit 1 n=1 Tax=Potamilus streckersoni TaxID=2493646 RepID=A0AAE0TF19_9BIVA|nr:hypothetical protein CHS0354_006835 [Potamilus streckersoni]